MRLTLLRRSLIFIVARAKKAISSVGATYRHPFPFFPLREIFPDLSFFLSAWPATRICLDAQHSLIGGPLPFWA
jgi:hypothetical protein